MLKLVSGENFIENRYSLRLKQIWRYCKDIREAERVLREEATDVDGLFAIILDQSSNSKYINLNSKLCR